LHAKKAITGARRKKEAERNRSRNLPVRSRVKGRIRAAVRSIEAGEASSRDVLLEATRELDKAATKGVIHQRTAARKKSRLTKRLNASVSGAEPAR